MGARYICLQVERLGLRKPEGRVKGTAFLESKPQIQSSLVAQTAKNLPAMQEIQVRSLDGEDPLEKEMATHSNILGWEIPWTEEPGGLQSMGLQKVGHDQVSE